MSVASLSPIVTGGSTDDSALEAPPRATNCAPDLPHSQGPCSSTTARKLAKRVPASRAMG